MTKFFLRLRGALALTPYTYEDIEADKTAFPQALAVVILSSLATGIAYLPGGDLSTVTAGVVAALLGWLIWSWLTYYIGSHWLAGPDTEADWGQLLRTTGFATAPGILRVMGLMVEARDPIFLLTSVWMLAGFVIAVRQALDYRKTWRAIVVCLIGWVIYAGFFFVVPKACQLTGPT
jgi:hypothetical protein